MAGSTSSVRPGDDNQCREHMNLSGNPFVDVGLAVAANVANQRSISDVTIAHVSCAVKKLRFEIDGLRSLKGVLSAFWVNNPFMGINPQQKAKFARYLSDVAEGALAV